MKKLFFFFPRPEKKNSFFIRMNEWPMNFAGPKKKTGKISKIFKKWAVFFSAPREKKNKILRFEWMNGLPSFPRKKKTVPLPYSYPLMPIFGVIRIFWTDVIVDFWFAFRSFWPFIKKPFIFWFKFVLLSWRFLCHFLRFLADITAYFWSLSWLSI